jgi:hypothetical protein
MYPKLVLVGCTHVQGPVPPSEPKSLPLLLRQKFAIFGGIAPAQPAQPRRESPMAQLDNVHSVLRLNYETLGGLISLASLSVAKPTQFETLAGNGSQKNRRGH